jgi:UDP-N-acetylglucosamine diphosphorylase / glucose-1-phosphate thymidylyltransferase / UDP-N-acetylgalactosamine diphosphorylase / glucosamine-1-phosphate N-acetyltransferase / galactosamine-1-phosphate N-acetyltransferase
MKKERADFLSFIAAGAYVRGGCWLEANCVLGPGAELKSSFVFAGTKLAHFNFVGDSILGRESISKRDRS